MDTDEAHRLLGLYVGATREQIEAKFVELAGRYSADDKPVPAQLETARLVALGEKAPLPKRGPRGWKVLLVMAVTMVIIASTSFIGVWVIDNKRDAADAEALQSEAEAARDAWRAYLETTGAAGGEEGERGDQLLHDAGDLLERGQSEEAARAFKDAIDEYIAAFESEDARVGQAWNRTVLAFMGERLAGRFPFDRNGDQDAQAEDVARLFNPVSGTVWAVARDYNALAEVELQSRRVATPLENFDQVIEQAGAVRDALFGARSPTIDTRFEMRLANPRVLVLLRLQVSGAEALSRGDNFVSVRWTQGDGGAALIRGGDASERKEVLIDLTDSEWGLARMLARGDYAGESNGIHKWEFDPAYFGLRRGQSAEVHIRPNGRNPFDFTIFEPFK